MVRLLKRLIIPCKEGISGIWCFSPIIDKGVAPIAPGGKYMLTGWLFTTLLNRTPTMVFMALSGGMMRMVKSI
jgi:hypothetical protein